ncbi:OmpA family protein [Reichenbachiella versicolor]|uniref:OmpA family protein n=1 Tax=Reichenbachiella versicolor TaxID=1821036 RepID=UPI000D6DDDBD|nr:OmpA family protein [Reichenbachiella versicolor]
MKQLILLTCALCASMILCAQDKNHKVFKKADHYFYKELFEEALKEYHKESEKYELTERALYHMEICSLLTDYTSKPVDQLLDHSKKGGKDDKFYQYWLGRVYFKRYEFTNAIDSWTKFRNIRAYKSPEIIEEIDFLTEWAKQAKAYHQDVGSFQITALPSEINSEASDYSPLYIDQQSELMFVTERHSDDKKEKFHVYTSKKQGEKWSKAEVDTTFSEFHPRHPQIEQPPGDDDIFYFSGHYLIDLINTQVDNNDTLRVEKAEKTSIRHFDGHFYINKEHDLVIFASRRRDKPNDMDIFKIERKEDGKWTKPILFSENILSFEDEDYPFLSDDGKNFYFSSKGFNAVGGFDIFRSILNEETGEWSKPIQLKFPMNTMDDDINFRQVTPTNGYFVSNRNGGIGEMDIYSFTKDYTTRLLADVRAEDSDSLIANILVDIKKSSGENVSSNIESSDNGKFEAVLMAENSYVASLRYKDRDLGVQPFVAPEDLDGSGKFEKTFLVDASVIAAIDEEERLAAEAEARALAKDPEYEEVENIASKFRRTYKAQLENIYFEFNNYRLKDQDRANLKSLVTTLKENPSVNIEIQGHADAIGTEEQNMKISKWRANTVKKYLEYKGIEEHRVKATAYGESKPLVPNEKEEERAKNRRIEIIVLD